MILLTVALLIGQSSSVWALDEARCPTGSYYDPRVNSCSPCFKICRKGRGSEPLCQKHATECLPREASSSSAVYAKMEQTNEVTSPPLTSIITETSSSSAVYAKMEQMTEVTSPPLTSIIREAKILSSSSSTSSSNPNGKPGAEARQEAEPQYPGLIVGLFLESSLLIVFVIIILVTQRCRQQSCLVRIFRCIKTKTVHAVHPVEEGKGQIQPSSSTPPRMFGASPDDMAGRSTVANIAMSCPEVKNSTGYDVEYDNYVINMPTVAGVFSFIPAFRS